MENRDDYVLNSSLKGILRYAVSICLLVLLITLFLADRPTILVIVGLLTIILFSYFREIFQKRINSVKVAYEANTLEIVMAKYFKKEKILMPLDKVKIEKELKTGPKGMRSYTYYVYLPDNKKIELSPYYLGFKKSELEELIRLLDYTKSVDN